MSKAFWRDLQTQLLGDVTTAEPVRAALAVDGGPYRSTPEGVVYPRNTADIRKAVRLLSARAEAGKFACLTPRGYGANLDGAAVGSGLQLVLPSHMAGVLRVHKDTVVVQPGVDLPALQQVLRAYGRVLPGFGGPQPVMATLGGLVASGDSGRQAVKYGPIRRWVRGLRAVLSDGSIIEAQRLTARQLHRKKGQTNLEGHIYRALDGLILDNQAVIKTYNPAVTADEAGYALRHVRGRDGSFDLAQILTGSEGTLAIITEITLGTLPRRHHTTVLAGSCSDWHQTASLVQKIVELRPSAIEIVDRTALRLLQHARPQELALLAGDSLPAAIILVEFDDPAHVMQTMHTRRAERLLQKHGRHIQTATDPIAQAALWNLRFAPAAVAWLADGAKHPVPGLQAIAVPLAQIGPFLTRLEHLLAKHGVEAPVWGSAGLGQLQIWPLLDLVRKKDRDRFLALSDDVADLVANVGGSLSAASGSGLARAHYADRLLGPELTALHRQVKAVFDPYHILNPGKKVGPASEPAPVLRDDYRLSAITLPVPYR